MFQILFCEVSDIHAQQFQCYSEVKQLLCNAGFVRRLLRYLQCCNVFFQSIFLSNIGLFTILSICCLSYELFFYFLQGTIKPKTKILDTCISSFLCSGKRSIYNQLCSRQDLACLELPGSVMFYVHGNFVENVLKLIWGFGGVGGLINIFYPFSL